MAKEKKTPIVERKKVVTIEYTLKDEHGKVLEDKNTLTVSGSFSGDNDAVIFSRDDVNTCPKAPNDTVASSPWKEKRPILKRK